MFIAVIMRKIRKLTFIGTLIVVILIYFTLHLSLDYDLYKQGKVEITPSYVKGDNADDVDAIFRIMDDKDQGYEVYYPVCPVVSTNPKVDIQMAEEYDRMDFDNIDGGVWKQGWEITYNQDEWDSSNKLKVFVVPHSHNDPGWLKTFEDYYQTQTRSILNNLVKKLKEDKRHKFIWAEISFFSLWWSEINDAIKEDIKSLVARGQLEFVTGGWVMNDEANSHYYSIFQQLYHGHQWLQEHLNYTPRYSWSIDPFGLSPTMPFLLKRMGFRGLVVQRSHYSVKKHLARSRNLEFTWRQLWDESGGTGLLTHMMPFYSYDVPHTCGPDPSVCCQFDFRRIPGGGLSCPWKKPPRRITPSNVRERAELLLDQYRKKAQLYRSNAVLIPLGDDFRYDTAAEWDNQFSSYKLLFDHINSRPELHAQAQFGTLSDYFAALEEEGVEVPTLTGDFFTYADRDDHYWSGYYTSRPFHKRLDRVLITALRSAEILAALGARIARGRGGPAAAGIDSRLSGARSRLALFQHHDGVTGTARDHVVTDYAAKLVEGLKMAQHVIQQSIYLLLNQGKVEQTGDEVWYAVDVHGRTGECCDSGESSIRFGTAHSLRRVTLFNPVLQARTHVVTLRVDTQLVKVMDSGGETLVHQLSPFCDLGVIVPSSCYLLSFVVTLPPLSLSTYSILPSEDDGGSLSTVRVTNWQRTPVEDWPGEQVMRTPARDFTVENDRLSLAFSRFGLLTAVTLKQPAGAITIPLNLTFIRYYARRSSERSGAYLFLPEGGGQLLDPAPLRPSVTVIQGAALSRVIVRLPQVVHSVTLFNAPGPEGSAIEIQNLVDISSINENYELAMRLTSNINSGPIFYTDLNGLQMIKRKHYNKLPLQGNYYPLPSAGYIEDSTMRLTLLSGQPLGAASLTSGQFEVMQDRRLLQDDNRGLDQGVMDNKATLNVFRLHLEPLLPNCRKEDEHWGALSDEALSSLHTLLYPTERAVWLVDGPASASASWIAGEGSAPPVGVHLVAALPGPPPRRDTRLVLASLPVDRCSAPRHSRTVPSPSGNATSATPAPLNVALMLPMTQDDRVLRAPLSFSPASAYELLPSKTIPLCSNDILALIVTNAPN